jgi:hypothetical protein
MTGDPAAQIRQDPRAKLDALRRDHPQYSIQLASSAMWEAVSRPRPGRTVVHIAESLDALRGKIESDAP